MYPHIEDISHKRAWASNVETTLYSDVSTFKKMQKNRPRQNVDTSLYSDVSHFVEILHK